VALVEFALLLPFLSMLTLGTVDLGRVYSLQHRLANASREGAVFARNYPGQAANSGSCADPNNIRYHALGENDGATAGFTVTVTNVTSGADLTNSCITSGITQGTKIKVTVSKTFTPLTPFGKQFLGNSSSPTIARSTQVVVQSIT
jgi:Flp pilus assembly protein TadG